MPSLKTECTELSVGFGLLNTDPTCITPERAVKLWDGTLDWDEFSNFITEFKSHQSYYRKFYNLGVEIANSHKILARTKISNAHWEGPRQQARSVSVPKDIVVAGVPVSIKADSSIVANPSPHKLFVSLPSGTPTRTRTEDWYLKAGADDYQNLYAFARNTCYPDFPAKIADYHNEVKGRARKILSSEIDKLSGQQQGEFENLYNTFCHKVSIYSADLFNSSLSGLDPSLKNSVLENVMRLFFRLGDSDYVLCGLDGNESFSVIIPNLSDWKRDWRLNKIVATCDLNRNQPVVDFLLVIEKKSEKFVRTFNFHAEVRWAHGKFAVNPEAKLYKEFKWVEVPFFEPIGSSQTQKFELIGKGGFGNVYRARRNSTGDIVALKEFSAKGDEIDRLRFEQEARIQQRLNHPNILPILMSELEIPTPWFVAPLAQCNLADILDQLPGNTKRIYFIFRQVLLGIKYAHEQNVIHRDIKPENILVFDNDQIKIGDFGLGKRRDTDPAKLNITQSGESLGTEAYSAPEQSNNFRDADHRADIYSLGKTLFHMVTGQVPPPFYNDIPYNAIEEKFRSFIKKCTEENPENRFESVEQALAVFDKIL